MPRKEPSGPRCAALVGPYLSGKTTLLESLLATTGAIPRKGSVKEGSSVGDSAPAARARHMSVEINVATTQFMDESWTFIDCPGSIEFAHESYTALMAADVAVVVCEPVPERALMLAPLLKFLDDHRIPHVLFINKIDQATARVRDILAAMQAVSARPLVLRHVPIREGERIAGYVDLVSERAYQYKPGQASDLVSIPPDVIDREKEARQSLLETLADFDDRLLEQLVEDTVPQRDEIYAHLTRNMRADRIVPVFFGSAERDNGVRRLLKMLRHEAPPAAVTMDRLDIPADGEPVAQVFKTQYAGHSGKVSYVRVWRGPLTDGMSLSDGRTTARIAGVFRPLGTSLSKLTRAETGEVVALGRLDGITTGATLTPSGAIFEGIAPWPSPPSPCFALAIAAEKRADEVKLSGALQKITEEDPSLTIEHNADTNEHVLWGQGEIHLAVALERLRTQYNMAVSARPPQVPYKETIRRGVTQHARHKRQTGGHGQFADVKVEIRPLPRGQGFTFEDRIVGGAIPRNFIPAVEDGIREYLNRGPLGFPVVDVHVTLFDGQYHDVDSSDQAFKTAGAMAMREGMPKCEPVLLEPICKVTIAVPNEFTSKVQRLIPQRRGQILGFDARPGWDGWDEVQAFLPQAEMHDLIVELRSATMGVGTFEWSFDHLAELTGKLAERVVSRSRVEEKVAT
ncbi:MAG TPA: elongation factor G [Alphaproteobacteria bacterium]